jgi:hypothetical protein
LAKFLIPFIATTKDPAIFHCLLIEYEKTNDLSRIIKGGGEALRGASAKASDAYPPVAKSAEALTLTQKLFQKNGQTGWKKP